MEPIKIDVAVSVNVDLSQGTKDFLLNILERKIQAENERVAQSYGPLKELIAMMLAQGTCNTPAPNEIAEAVETMVQKASDAGKAAGEAEAKAIVEAAKTEPVPSKENTSAAPSIGIEDVRKALAEKVNDHRSVIKNKLTEFGAPSVTKLDPSKYQEMYDFLKSL